MNRRSIPGNKWPSAARFLVAGFLLIGWRSSDADTFPEPVRAVFETHCLDCHDTEMQKGGLDLSELRLNPGERENLSRWIAIHDKVREGAMPPAKKGPLPAGARVAFLDSLSAVLEAADRVRIRESGRATVRRLNRFEYENCLREGLNAPWLQVAHLLPEDGTVHLFNKVGERLDLSHVQIAKYLEVADYALRMALRAAAYPGATNRFYARDEPGMQRYLRWRPGLQTAATRAAIPLVDTTPQPEVIRGNEPMTVGDSDPDLREREAMGFVSGTYTATTKYDFTRVHIPVDGRYRIRMKTYTFLAGPNGASGGDDHGLTGGRTAWWRPSRTVAYPGTRSEPVTLYALADSGDSRWLATFDSLPEPRVIEREVVLRQGEKIRPDATRLVRTRPGWKGNPNATTRGVPGFAMNWLEIEGPLHDAWPPSCYTALFDDLPFAVEEDDSVRVQTETPDEDARRLLTGFMRRFFRNPAVPADRVEPFLDIYRRARAHGEEFTDAMISGFTSILCSSGFLLLDAPPGSLDNAGLASRLSLFLWNGPPDEALLEKEDLRDPSVLGAQADRLLDDPRSDRFVEAFLDYWLDLREINANAPDAALYPDYYLDDWLTESSVFETRRFFRELIDRNLPARNLVASDFTFANERLASLYELPPFEGVELRRVALPAGSLRGGLLTQASVLRVTANGTTTSPVIRGAWVMERIMGLHIPPPPSGVEAVTPDIRGATTIREQIGQHSAEASCRACHVRFDPIGFALESFDIAGGRRDRYRALGDLGDPVEGIGKNGHAFTFRNAQPVDSSGELKDGVRFEDIDDLRRRLLADERVVARNLLRRLMVYATGAPISFADRPELEGILDEAQPGGFGVRTLIHGVVRSEMFRSR